MGSLRDAATAFNGKKDLSGLDKIPVDIEIKEASFEKDGQVMKYNFIEIGNWKYTIKAKDMEKIQQLLAVRPQTKFIKFQKAPNGEMYVIPLD